MTSVDRKLYTALTSDPTLSGIIGTRLQWMQLAQGTAFPCGVYQRVTSTPLYAQMPPGGKQAHVGQARYQLTFWSNSKDADLELESIVQAVLGVLGAFNAWALNAFSPAVTVSSPNMVLNRTDSVEPKTDPPLFKTRLDVRIWYQDQ